MKAKRKALERFIVALSEEEGFDLSEREERKIASLLVKEGLVERLVKDKIYKTKTTIESQ